MTVVGLDIGTSSAKGLRIGADGAVLGSAEEPYPVSRPRPGYSEQDPADWVGPYAEAREHFRALYPALRALRSEA